MSEEKEKSTIRKSIESYANHSVLVFSGSLMVLSITFNNIGLGKIIDAYAQQMVAEIEHKKQARNPVVPPSILPDQCTSYSVEIEDLDVRIHKLELVAHKSGKQHK
jgi:hypothetical protein